MEPNRTIGVVALIGFAVVASFMNVGCGPECGPNTHEVDGECVPICGVGQSLGEDGLCYPVDSDGDSDVDSDADSDVDSDADSDVDSDSDSDVDSGGDADSGMDGDENGGSDRTPEEDQLFTAVNDLHTEAGCLLFIWDDRVAEAALACAQRMADTESFDVCGDPRDRLAAAGLADIGYVRQTYGYREDIETFVSDLVSNEHVEDCQCTLAGVGLVHSEIWGGGYFACTIYVKLR